MALFKKENLDALKEGASRAMATAKDLNDARVEMKEQIAERKEAKQEAKQLKKDQKVFSKAEKTMKEYGIDDLSDVRDARAAIKIADSMSSDRFSKIGVRFMGMAGIGDLYVMQADYNDILMEQNFILIRQMERMNRNLEKLLEK